MSPGTNGPARERILVRAKSKQEGWNTTLHPQNVQTSGAGPEYDTLKVSIPVTSAAVTVNVFLSAEIDAPVISVLFLYQCTLSALKVIESGIAIVKVSVSQIPIGT